jgi:multiple sugar transport system substrate-binding protein
MTRRSFLSRTTAGATAVAAGAGGLASCSSSTQDTDLEFWQYYAPAPAGGSSGETAGQSAWMLDLVDAWNKTHPDHRIRASYIPTSDYLNGTKLSTSFASGDGPDIFMINAPMFLRYANDGALHDLRGVLAPESLQDFKPDILGTMSVDDKIYALPAESEPVLVYYDKSAFENAGLSEGDIPTTWDAFLDVADKLTDDTRFGLCLDTNPGDYQNFTWYPFMWQAGGDVADSSGHATFDGPGVVKALALWKDAITSKVAPRTVQGTGGNDLPANLGDGLAGMQLMVSGGVSILGSAVPDLDFGVFKLPVPEGGEYATAAGGWSWAVNSQGRDPDTSAEFVTWALAETGKDGVSRAADWSTVQKNGCLSARNSVNKYAQDQGTYDTPEMTYINKEVLDGARGEPRYPDFVKKQVSDAVQGAMLGDLSPESAADKAQETIANFLETYDGASLGD